MSGAPSQCLLWNLFSEQKAQPVGSVRGVALPWSENHVPLNHPVVRSEPPGQAVTHQRCSSCVNRCNTTIFQNHGSFHVILMQPSLLGATLNIPKPELLDLGHRWPHGHWL